MLDGAANSKSKGRVVFYAGSAFESCVSVTASFARRKPDGTFEPAGNSFINYDFLWSTKLGGIDLEPGDYVFAGLICPRRDHSFATYSGPLGSFTVAAGEIVDIGEITVIAIEPRGDQNAIALVSAQPEKRLATLKSEADLARRYVSRPLESSATLQDLLKLEEQLLNAPKDVDELRLLQRALVLAAVRSAREELQK